MPNVERVEQALSDMLTKAEQRWPNVEMRSRDFVVFLGHRSSDGDLGRLQTRVEDLFLAFGCEQNDPAAIAAFDELVGQCKSVFRRCGFADADLDEMLQQLRTRLLLARDGKAPRIASYQGTASLLSWLRAVAARQGISELRRRKPEEPFDFDMVDDSQDPRLRALKEKYKGEFQIAIQASVADLPSKDRAVLRAILVDEATVGEVAKLFGIHRVTASRWLSKIRQTLLQNTRKRLAEQLQLSSSEIDSVVRMIESGLDVSLHGALYTPNVE